MDSHREAVEKIGAALNSFLQAGGSGNSNELASKLQELLILIKSQDKSLAQMIPLEPLVASLDVYGWNGDVCKAVCGIIELIIETSEFSALIEKYQPALEAAARNPDTDLAMLAVKALKLGLTDENLPLLVETGFFVTIVKRIASPNVELADTIFLALKDSNIYPAYPAKMEDLLMEAAYDQGIQDAMLAVLEVLVSLRKKVPNSASVYSGVDEFIQSKDLLLQLCGLQIVIQNADSLHDFEILSAEGGIIDSLVSRLPQPGNFCVNEEPIYCRAFTLFSQLISVPGTNWEKFINRIVPALEACLAENSEAQKDAVHLAGLLLLNDTTCKYFDCFQETFFSSFSSSSPAIKAVCLYTATKIFASEISSDLKQNVLAKGIGAMGKKSPFSNLQDACCSAIDEVKDSAYRCLSSLLLSNQAFAEEAMGTSEIFLFLVNRLADPSTAGLQAKYDLIKSLLGKSWASTVFNQPMLDSFTRYIHQGVYFNEATPQVAIQS